MKPTRAMFKRHQPAQALEMSIESMRTGIAEAASLQEAWSYYKALRPLAHELNALLDAAAERVETIMRDM